MPHIPVEVRENGHDLLAFIDQVVRRRAQAGKGKPQHPAIGRIEQEHPEKEDRHAEQHAGDHALAERLCPLHAGNDRLLCKKHLVKRARAVVEPRVLDNDLRFPALRSKIYGVKIGPRGELSGVIGDGPRFVPQFAVDIDPLRIGGRLAGHAVGLSRFQREHDPAGLIFRLRVARRYVSCGKVRAVIESAGIDLRVLFAEADIVLGKVGRSNFLRRRYRLVFRHGRGDHHGKEQRGHCEKYQNQPDGMPPFSRVAHKRSPSL